MWSSDEVMSVFRCKNNPLSWIFNLSKMNVPRTCVHCSESVTTRSSHMFVCVKARICFGRTPRSKYVRFRILKESSFPDFGCPSRTMVSKNCITVLCRLRVLRVVNASALKTRSVLSKHSTQSECPHIMRTKSVWNYAWGLWALTTIKTIHCLC